MSQTIADTGALTQQARAAHRRVLVVVGAMTMSLFVYAILVEVINRSVSFNSPGVSEVVRWAFYGVAVTMVFTSHVVKSVLLRGLDQGDAETAFARLNTAHIVTAAMSEAPAILGLVLFFLDRRFYTDFYIFTLISVYLLFRHFPRSALWENTARRHMASQ